MKLDTLKHCAGCGRLNRDNRHLDFKVDGRVILDAEVCQRCASATSDTVGRVLREGVRSP